MESYKLLKAHFPDEEALFSIMGSYYNELFLYGVKFTGNAEETKDALNSFFIHIWESRYKLEKVENFKAYIFVCYKRWLIARLKELRKSGALHVSEEAIDAPAELSFEEVLILQIKDRELKKIISEAIADMSPRQRQLIRMRFYENKSFEEISQSTSLSIRTVYNKLHEAIKKLRTHKLIAQLRKQ